MKIVIQGYPGCFHEEAARKYFNGVGLKVLPSDSFDQLARLLEDPDQADLAIMAIENSIAGTILQNYRILREHGFQIVGEVYLRIQHHLMALPGSQASDLTEVQSHFMAINQCRAFLRTQPQLKWVEIEDTALAAKRIQENAWTNTAAIASRTAAELYGLEILAEGIETSKANYTRFFILRRGGDDLRPYTTDADKASIYFRIQHKQGSLLKVLQKVDAYQNNMTKLQSFPVMGNPSEYYFHMDLTFPAQLAFEALLEELEPITQQLFVLGMYKKADIYARQTF